MASPGYGWTTVAFGDVVELNNDRVQDPLSEGLDRYVGLEHLEPGDLKIRRWGNVANGTTFTSVFRPGHVLFGKRRAYQRKVAVADFSGVCSGDIYVLTPKDDRLLPDLLPFLCQTDSFFDHAIGTSAGSLSPRTNWKSLAGYEFALPPLKEQRRIANALKTIETTIEATTNLRDLFDDLETALVDSFIAQLQAEGTVPVPLRSSCEGTPSYGFNAPGTAFDATKPRYIRITDIENDGTLSMQQGVSVDIRQPHEYSIEPGDLLFARTGNTVGKVYLADGREGNAVFAGYLIRFRPKKDRVDPRFLFALTRSTTYRAWIAERSRVGAQPNINATEYGEMPVWIPRSHQQQAHLVRAATDIRAGRRTSIERALELNRFKKRLLAASGLEDIGGV